MLESATDARLALTTTANRDEANRIGRVLVEEHLAACATVIPAVESVYWWQGQIESSVEALLLLKTVSEKLAALEARLRALHTYETPEFLVLTVESGSEAYLAWLRASLGNDLP
jgi:periplasmic divalent cation tolerance protein